LFIFFKCQGKIRGIGHHAHRIVVDIHLAIQKFDDDARAGFVEKDVVEWSLDISHERNFWNPDTDRSSLQRLLDLRDGFEVAEKIEPEVRGSQSLRGIGSGTRWRLRPGQFIGADR